MQAEIDETRSCTTGTSYIDRTCVLLTTRHAVNRGNCIFLFLDNTCPPEAVEEFGSERIHERRRRLLDFPETMEARGATLNTESRPLVTHLALFGSWE